MTTETELLCQQLLDAKAEEEKAKKRRIELEESIILKVGVSAEGSVTDSHGSFKVTTTGALTRKVVDWDVFKSIPSDIASQLVKTTHALDISGYRAVEKVRPDLIAIINKGIETKPRKASVKVVFNG